MLWSGEPKRGIVFRPEDTYLIPMGLAGVAFGIYWMRQVMTIGAPGFFPVFGVITLMSTTYIAVGRFFYDAWRRARTAYGLTNDRVIIATSGLNAKVQSLNLQALPQIILTERPDGSGTIAFGIEPPSRNRSWGQLTGIPSVPSFELIPSAKQVYNAVRDARQRLIDRPSAESSRA